MHSVWFVRKDDPKIRKFDGHYLTRDLAQNRVNNVVYDGLVSCLHWNVIIKSKG